MQLYRKTLNNYTLNNVVTLVPAKQGGNSDIKSVLTQTQFKGVAETSNQTSNKFQSMLTNNNLSNK